MLAMSRTAQGVLGTEAHGGCHALDIDERISGDSPLDALHDVLANALGLGDLNRVDAVEAGAAQTLLRDRRRFDERVEGDESE